MYRIYDMSGKLLEWGTDFDSLKIDAFIREPSQAVRELSKRHISQFIKYEMFDSKSKGKPTGYIMSTKEHDDMRSSVPDDVTGAASPSNVQFVGDSATFDSLSAIRKLSDSTAARYAGSSNPRPDATVFTDYAMQVLAIVYENSKEK